MYQQNSWQIHLRWNIKINWLSFKQVAASSPLPRWNLLTAKYSLAFKFISKQPSILPQFNLFFPICTLLQWFNDSWYSCMIPFLILSMVYMYDKFRGNAGIILIVGFLMKNSRQAIIFFINPLFKITIYR